MAVIAKQRYKLDIAPKGGWVIVYASQHDDGAREIEFAITNQGNAFSIPASINVSVQGIKSNKSYFSHSCSYSGNIVTMALADDMTDIIGQAICVLKFTNSSQQKLATAKFILNVDSDSSSEGVIIDTEAEEIFNKMLNDIRAQAASISADIAELQSMVGSPLVASLVSEMVDTDKIYVYVGSETGYTNGNWYYYNGSNWISGGVYNSIAFETDTTLTQSGQAADAKVVGDEIDGLKSEVDALEPQKNYIEGYYVARDGSLVADEGYCVSELIPCANIYPKNCTFYYGTYGGAKTNFVTYDANGDFIQFWGASSGVEMRSISTLPDTAVYCRFGFVKGYNGKLTQSQGFVYWKAQDISQAETAVYGYSPTVRRKSNSGNLAVKGVFLEVNAIKNPTIMFYGKIGTFDSISIGHGQGETYTQYVTIDDTNLTFYSGTGAGSSIAHGLTIDTYIAVSIVVKSNCDYTVRINTLSGTYSRNMVYPSNWIGNKGNIFVKPGSSGTITDYNFTFTAPYEKTKWIFGDSYLSNYSSARWPYYMQQWGYDNALLNAFPGEDSKEAYNDLMSAFNHGSPKYLVWCLGMNDPDEGAINANWLNIVQRVKADCDRRNIELILATIPNVPIYNHTYKNTWVKSSGLRYIDFAEAVGASETGSTWYTGCLETTTPRIHPTADGARLLSVRALSDFPELMQS